MIEVFAFIGAAIVAVVVITAWIILGAQMILWTSVWLSGRDYALVAACLSPRIRACLVWPLVILFLIFCRCRKELRERVKPQPEKETQYAKD